MPKLPGKFEDISKTASSVLGDDFQCKDFQLKAKQKSKFIDATSEIQVDLFGKDDCKTPAKLNFKFPTPLDSFSFLKGLSVEKLELAKDGKTNMECAIDKTLHGVDGLKVEVKSDLVSNLKYACTYEKDVKVKLELPHLALAKLTAECLYGGIGGVVIGVKYAGNMIPNVGANFASGDFFASVIAVDQVKQINAHGHYKVNKDTQVAATYQYGGKTDGAWSVGGSTSISKELSVKAKFESSQKLSVAFKQKIADGATLLGGMSYGLGDGSTTYGAKVSIE